MVPQQPVVARELPVEPQPSPRPGHRLANDPTTSDDLFQWLLGQAHSKEQHALGIQEVRFIHQCHRMQSWLKFIRQLRSALWSSRVTLDMQAVDLVADLKAETGGKSR